MKVIITGATGVIGLPLILELQTRGCDVTVLTSPGSVRNLQLQAVVGSSVRCIECGLDYYDNFSLSERFDAFCHMAWSGGLDRWNVGLNLASAEHCASAARLASRLGCQVFVATGSQAECGPQQVPLSAFTVCEPDTPFGAAKNLARDLARIEARKNPSMRFNWARVLSVYGPYDREGSMILDSVRKLLRGELPTFTEADQIWDFLYATDAASALADILQFGHDGQTYVLGSGQARPLREYITTMVTRFGIDPMQCLGRLSKASTTPNHLSADLTPLIAHTGWKPAIDFKEGLEKTIMYCSAN